MAQHGLGARVVEALHRREAVPKSALAKGSERPSPQRHFETLESVGLLELQGRLILVDDVVTKGSTFLGAARRLQASYPEAKICAFAAVRTLGLQPDIEVMIEPCTGSLREVDGEAVREP